MSGPSYGVRIAVKGLAKALGADNVTANIIGRIANVGSSLIFHDHHTHFHTDPGEISDAHQTISDHIDTAQDLQRSGTSELDLNHQGFRENTKVFITHTDWKDDHWGVIKDFQDGPNPDTTDIKISTDKFLHDGEWVSESHVHLDKTY